MKMHTTFADLVGSTTPSHHPLPGEAHAALAGELHGLAPVLAARNLAGHAHASDAAQTHATSCIVCGEPVDARASDKAVTGSACQSLFGRCQGTHDSEIAARTSEAAHSSWTVCICIDGDVAAQANDDVAPPYTISYCFGGGNPVESNQALELGAELH